jgi:hypothetical protein
MDNRHSHTCAQLAPHENNANALRLTAYALLNDMCHMHQDTNKPATNGYHTTTKPHHHLQHLTPYDCQMQPYLLSNAPAIPGLPPYATAVYATAATNGLLRSAKRNTPEAAKHFG